MLANFNDFDDFVDFDEFVDFCDFDVSNSQEAAADWVEGKPNPLIWSKCFCPAPGSQEAPVGAFFKPVFLRFWESSMPLCDLYFQAAWKPSCAQPVSKSDRILQSRAAPHGQVLIISLVDWLIYDIGKWQYQYLYKSIYIWIKINLQDQYWPSPW